MNTYILALDQGTTSSRALLFDKSGTIVDLAQEEFDQHYPKPGWVEHDAGEIWRSQAGVVGTLISKRKLTRDNIHAIGITNQRETTLLWNRKTGEPVAHAIVWQDRRTSAMCDELKKAGHEKMIRTKTGLVIDAYFSATKIKWMLDHVSGAREEASRGELAFGTMDTWLIWKLTSGKVHVTDVTNASRTMLFNINTMAWDEELLKLLDIPASVLPKVMSSSEVYGETSCPELPAGIPIAGIAGDQQAALFGQMCTKRGMVKNTYGTGCFMLMNIGDKPIISKNNLVTTVAWKIGDEVRYALEGSIFVAGAVVQWLRDGLGVIKESKDVEPLAASVEDTGGVYFVPAFTGLGAPHWDQDARGTIVGLTRGTTAAHLARAAVESMAFQTYDVLKAMESDAGAPVKELRVDGGAAVNNTLMQFQAGVLNATVVRPAIVEVTAMGAAFLAGLATNFWGGLDEINSLWKVDRSFKAERMDDLDEKLKGWNAAVKAARMFGEGSKQ